MRYIGGVEDPELLAAAALHDVLETTPTKSADLQKRFGDRVADLVQQVTRSEPTLEEIAGLTDEQVWKLRHKRLMAEIAKMGAEAKQIKLADRSSNLTCALATRKGDKRERYLMQSAEMLKLIGREVSPALWDSVNSMLNGGGVQEKPAQPKKPSVPARARKPRRKPKKG
jgi:(p)ppGpp synthase/HD superfamily hydrolase